MKKKLAVAATLLVTLLCTSSALAQATANYVYATNVSGTFTDMSSGTTQLVPAGADDGASVLTNIGFDFVFMGTRYAQFSASSNGYIRLGAVVSTTQYALATGALPLITAMGSDMIVSTSGKVHYKVTGAAPNRVLTVEWLNETIIYDGVGTSTDGTYQVRLHETTGQIEAVYGAMNRNTGTGFSNAMNAQYVGFSTTATAFATVDFGTNSENTSGTAFGNQATLGAPIPNLNTPTDGSRRVYSFTPPIPNPPTGLSFTGVTPIAMTLNWTDSSNELSYLVYRSTDGVNYTFDGTAALNATSYNATGLLPNTTYFWQVYAISEGGMSSPLSGSQLTPAGGNVSSTAAGGLWSAPATWAGGVVPTSTDNVTIADGATVTIDTAASALSLNVGTGGAAAVLQYETTTARTLTVGTNVLIASNGTFRTGAAGLVTTHVLSVGINLTNNGVLDFSTNANTAGATITFTGPNNTTFSGSGATTDIRQITVSKGTTATTVVEITTSNLTVQGVTTDVAGWLVFGTGGTFKLSGTFAGTNRVFTGASYTIPTTGAFWLNNPNYTVAGQNGSPTLAGLLRITQGTFNIGTATGNSMGFSAGSTVIIEGGAVNAAGRFGVAAAGNAINYTQSAGTVTVCTIGNASATLGSFDLGTSLSSNISLSGGTIVAQLAASAIDYRMQSGAGPDSITGGTLQLGNAASGAAKTFNLRGIMPAINLTTTSANHNATVSSTVTAAFTFTAAMGNITIGGGTLNLGNTPFIMFGPSLTNNGTLTATGGSSRLYWAGSVAQTYSGSGVTTAPMTSFELDNPLGLTLSSTNQVITGRIILFTGSITGANKITLGNGGATSGIVQIGNTTTPLAAGTLDSAPTFNLGTGGEIISYLRTTASRSTGFEVNPTRTLTTMTYDDDNPTHTLTIAGGDLTVTGASNLTNGRIVTGANTLIAGGTVARTAGYVDGNLRKPFAAAGSATFELGTANGYTPVTFNATAGTFPTNVTIAAIQTAAPGIQPASQVITRYWNLTASGVTADVTFSYLDPTDIPVTVPEGGMHVFRHESGNPADYSDQGGVINTAANTATVSGVTSFSAWTLATPGAELSITKTDGVTNATPGGSVTYTITAGNNGPGANTSAGVTDTFPAGLTCSTTCTGALGGTCTAGPFAGNINDLANIPSGGTVTYTSTCTVDSSLTGTLSNTASVAPGAVNDSFAANNSATDNDALAASADFSITKTDGVTTATPGGSVTYTITASNAGPSAGSGVTVADTFPAVLTCTWTCVGAGGGTCTASGSGNLNDSTNLPVGGSVTYTASCSIASSATGTLSNTATVAAPGGISDPTPGNNSATDSDTLAASADLSITKTDGVTTATPGGSVTYTITASNAGPSNALGSTIADTFPASLTCTWTCAGLGGGTCTASGSGNINGSANLPSGGSVTYTASCNISASATGTLSNTATVAAPGGVTDPTPGNNSATDSDTLAANADLSITKTDGVTNATPGGSVTYTITASNAGPSNASGSTVADTFPASLTCTWTCVGAGGGTCTAAGSGNINDTTNLPSGGAVTYTASCTISGAASGTLSNTATVAAPAGVTDSAPGNNSATDSDTLGANADLSITKTDGVTTATPGGSTTYTITASNAGPSSAAGSTVADTFPASLTCTWTCVGAGGGTCTASGSGNINDSANLPSGGSVTYTASCTISGAASGTLSNTATVAAPAGVTDSNPGNNSATDSDTLGGTADLSITKTDGVTTATAGGSVTYTITASNAGPSNATGATVADTFPASLTCSWTCVGAGGGTCTASGSGNINNSVNLPGGGSVTYTASCTISSSATGTLSNTATVAAPAGMTESNPGNNSATDSDTLVASANLSITKTDGVTTATAGGSTTYTITASNAGPSNASGATVADTFPASLTCTWTCVGAGGGTCTASGSGNLNDTVNLPSGGSVTYTAACTISGAATGTLSNTATVAAPGGVTDPTPGNNSATDSDTLGASADLSITKTDGVTTATAGGSTTYTITASNAGPSNASGATVADTFPASLTCTWTCVGAGGGTCTASGSGNLNDTVNLPSGGSVTYTAACTISGAATGTLSNTATVAAPGGVTDPTPGNNSATDSDTLGASADLSITKTDGVTTATAGGSTTYTITASNAGPSNATGATVADTFPASLTCTWTCVGAGGGTCTASGSGNLNDTVNLPSGGSVTYTAACTISGAATGTLSNTATVAAPGGVTDPTPGNNSATDSDTLGASADLSITKTDGVTTATAGGSTTYTITASNAGPSNATGATVADTFPASLTCTWTCAGLAGGTCTASGSGNINDTVNLPSGGSVTYTASCSISGSASGTLSNTATVAAPGGVTDPTPGNNSATDTDTLGASADLSITKTDGVTSVSAGGSTTYTITASNVGPSNASGASVADTFPASLTCTWTCVGAGGGTCTASGSGNLNDSVNLPSGASVTYTAACTISGSASGTLTNTATIAPPGSVTDPTPGNNSATDSDTISAAGGAAVSGTKSVSGSFTAGSNVTYTIVLTNNGSGAQGDNPGNEFVDVLPPQLTLVSASASSGSAVAIVATNTVTWNGGIAAGGSVTITITATVEANPVGTTISNRGTISYDSDGNGTNDTTTQTDSAGGGATVFQVSAGGIPALSPLGLSLLIGALAALAAAVLKRQ
ncbi:MAG: DUF11 domain-containing protein [Acidobacteria bacterium]|nr:DUF11 domain-containing protein [Acidobacteriota bacterium]MBV9477803.1 DUF11 domain-containing protein [Acidobacteriota bacterium]